MGKYTTKVTQSDIDNIFDSAKVIVVDQTKADYPAKEYQRNSRWLWVGCYRPILISKKWKLWSSFTKATYSQVVSHYFDVGLKVWKPNIAIQPVLNDYNVVINLWQYFSKAKDQCLEAWNKPENPLRATCIIKTLWKQLLNLT